MYHDPCHTPIKTQNPVKVTSELLGNQTVIQTDRCCGEAGTFAVSRPDIASQLRFRKEESLQQGIQALTGETKAVNGNVKLLTNCPACQQGLSRYTDSTGLDTDYIVVEMCKHLLGEDWSAGFVKQISNGGIEKVLL